MQDIVERIKREIKRNDGSDYFLLLEEAGDEITALRGELALAEKFLCSNKEWCDGKAKKNEKG
jgi:hypothetical protein